MDVLADVTPAYLPMYLPVYKPLLDIYEKYMYIQPNYIIRGEFVDRNDGKTR